MRGGTGSVPTGVGSLGGKDIVEAPKDLCAKAGEGLDKDGGLNGHVE